MNKYREKAVDILKKYQDQYTPEHIKTVDFQLGIDEAGRGPVFGSMIYSALWWPIHLKQELSSLGFNDSKVLTEEQRENLLEVIDLLRGKLVFYSTKELTAEYISTSMKNQHQHNNLNQISHSSALELCRQALAAGFRITNIYADTVGDPTKYANLLREGLIAYASVVKQVIVQPKADRDHKVVSASSICAKVTRDRIIKGWKFRQQLQFKGQLGSGYPGDPKTKEWLQNNKHPVFGYPNLIRFSWNTSVNALQTALKVKAYENEEEKQFTANKLFETPYLHKDLWTIVKQ